MEVEERIQSNIYSLRSKKRKESKGESKSRSKKMKVDLIDISDYEKIVRNMIKEYELLLDDWKSGDYYSEKSTIPTLYSLIKRLREYVPKDENIYSWRQNEEWPESLDYSILSSIVHLLLNPDKEDVPEGIKKFVGEQVFVDEDSRKKLLFNAYFKTLKI